jgi:Leucine-rich repeat (LRR) protein
MTIKYRFVLRGETFECGSMEDLTNLHNYHDIVDIDCSNNKLTVLPTLPNSLRYLYCFNNLLKVLPTLPNSLEYLYCYHNKITVLPTLPNSLIHLWCYYNKITVLPYLPNSLTHLYCYYNRLTLLPTLPQNLEYFDCSSNLLKLLPTLPNSLTHLYCNNIFLAFLPKFRDSLEHKFYYDNPVAWYIRDKCDNNLDVYHRVNEIFATKLVKWYLNCRENPIFKFCRRRLDRDYDALMDEDSCGIMVD